MLRIITLSALLVLACIGLHGQTLVHYWNFNNSADEAALLAPSVSQVAGASIAHVSGGSSAIQTTSNTGNGFDTVNPNARNGDPAGTHLRFNNPIGGALLFALPTTGYQQIVVRYGARRSGSGAGAQIIHYTVDGVSFDSLTTIAPVDGDPTVQTLDFSDVATANDNPLFAIRITFAQGSGGTVGNNRFDNFTLEGNTAGADTTPPTVAFTPNQGAVNVAANVQPTLSFNEDIQLAGGAVIDNAAIPAIVQLRLNDAGGAMVAFSGSILGRVITITPESPLANGQTYYIALNAGAVQDISGNVLADLQATSFTTIVPQTVFQPGDIVPVAYRMNATGGEDEVALLTFVNILPGTRINLTDAKYTDNAQPQCPGGITWTSPDQPIPAGSVFVIRNDAGTAGTGTITGSTFGLSSNGDQVIVYTGTPAEPAYITALSSNAWVSSPHTACGGSLSLIPAGLQDGVSAINLSTAPGNTGGNTVNAYYNGIQTGTVAGLRAAILDAANWVGIGSGTPPQVWPAWNFPGPPQVVSARVSSATTIQLAFNNDLTPASATSTVNYTGIAGLVSAVATDNGALPDTVTLTYDTPFAGGLDYSLAVADIVDAEGRQMLSPFNFTFNYTTRASFANRFVSVSEEAGEATIRLNIENPSPAATLDLVVKSGIFSTAGAADIALAETTTLALDAANGFIELTIPIVDDSELEQDEYLVLALENAVGVSVTGNPFYTVYIRDNDRRSPEASKAIELNFAGRYTAPNPEGAEGLTEIVAYDPTTRRLFTISTGLQAFDIVDFSVPATPVQLQRIDVSSFGGGITSIAVKDGIVAVCVPGIASEQDNGAVAFFDVNGAFISQVEVGALPDMITFTPDGARVLTANEGQPNDAYTIDPEGSVSIIDISGGVAGLTQANVTTVGFEAFNDQTAALTAAGYRLLFPGSTLAQDAEPEYITISADSKTAWVTLQENNAIAELDLETLSFTRISPLGVKDYSLPGNGLDLSDQSGVVHIANYPLKGFYLPDGTANYTVGGVTYLVTANEGDEKEYAGLNERTTVSAVTLDPAAFPNAQVLRENHNMGRFRISNRQGDTDGDGDFDELYAVGARSFSIWNAATGQLVFDSGDDFETITRDDPHTAPIFNADNEGNGFKGRSRAKGPEPEGVTLAVINGHTYAFITLERIGGVMTYDVTDPLNPAFVDYTNSRDNTTYAGDNGPEGVLFISAADSPDGNAYVVTANELSGTLAIFNVNVAPTLSFIGGFASMKEGDGEVEVKVRVEQPGSAANVTLKVVEASTAVAGDDYVLSTSTLSLAANANDTLTFVVNLPDNGALTGGRYLILTLDETAGIALGSRSDYLLLVADNDIEAPVAQEDPFVNLRHLGSFAGSPNGGSAEISAYDPASKRLFVTNITNNTLDVLNFADPNAPVYLQSIDMSVYGGGINSVAVKNGIVAAAVQGGTTAEDGKVVFFDANGVFVNAVTVGNLPDMVIFDPAGTRVLTANEGEPSSDYSIDPLGSVSIIDITGGAASLTQANVTTLTFESFNGQAEALRAAGIRLFGPNASVASDLEPEYICISPDGASALVTLQENNAVAVVDLQALQVTSILPLGYKDHTLAANAIDASDRGGKIFSATWPIKGAYMPDAIECFEVGGVTYAITANEGDAREYGNLVESQRLKDLDLDPAAFPDAAYLQRDELLGRLNVTSLSGDTDGDGDLDEIYAFGGRSITIWNTLTGQPVWDSGDDLEAITANDPTWGPYFNASNGATPSFKNRSDDKGPEPESVTVAQIEGRTFAFVGLERIGGVVVYEVSDPANPIFIQYINTRQIPGGDLGPEGMVFIPKAESPNGRNLLVVSNEISGTLSVFQVDLDRTHGGDVTLQTFDYTPTTSIVEFQGQTIFDGGISGLHYIPGAELEFYAISDRGPNADATAHPNATGTTLLFPAPDYAPLITRFKAENGGWAIQSIEPLRRPDGSPTSGLPLPAGAGATGETAWADTTPVVLNPDVWGIDSEGIVEDNNGDLWLCDEYGASVWRINKTTKQVIKRYTPFPTQAQDAALPANIGKRRANRGFEGVAVAPNGRVYTILQSPADNPTTATGNSSRLIRLVEINPANDVIRQFAYELPPTTGQIRTRDWKIGDLVAVNNDEFLVLEHAERNGWNVKNVVKINIANATPLSTEDYGGQTLEQVGTSAGLAAFGVVTVAKQQVLDLLEAGWDLTHDKPEGLTIINDTTIAVVNDNDFGINSPAGDGSIVFTGKTTRLYIFGLPQALGYASPYCDYAYPQPNVTACRGDVVRLDAGEGFQAYQWNTGATTPFTSVTVAGTYSVTVTNEAGCRAADTVTVSFNPLPVVNLGQDQNLCQGATLTLEAGAGFAAYQWSTGAVTPAITVSNAGNYTVTVTDANGCQANDQLRIIVVPNPIVDLGPDTTIAFPATLTLDAGSGFAGYAWNTGATTQTISVDETGEYVATVTDANGCTGSDAVIVTIITGSEDLEGLGGTLTLAPNPAAEWTDLRFREAAAGRYHISIFDLAGRLLREQTIDAAAGEFTTRLDLAQLAKGAYLVKVSAQQGAQTIRLIVQ